MAAIYTTIDKRALKYDTIDRGERFTGTEWTAVDAKGPMTVTPGANGDGSKNGELKEVPALRVDEDGISPRSRPGIVGGRFWSTSDEHDPDGHITEGVEMRMAMMHMNAWASSLSPRKRSADMQYALHGPADADLTVVAWGSTKGTILDALRIVDARARR